MDWILELQRASQETFPGASLEELRHAENEIGERLPGELADLYTRMSGGALPGEVILFRLTDGPDGGVIEKTRKKMIGLPAAGLWRFGRQGDATHLIAVRASSIRDVHSLMLPAWCAERPPDAWLFGTWAERGGEEELKLYPSLERMMSVLVPPREDTSFGEDTYVRALDAVEKALLTSMHEAATSTRKAHRAERSAATDDVKAGKRSKKSDDTGSGKKSAKASGTKRAKKAADAKPGKKGKKKAADTKREKAADSKSEKKGKKKDADTKGKKKAAESRREKAADSKSEKKGKKKDADTKGAKTSAEKAGAKAGKQRGAGGGKKAWKAGNDQKASRKSATSGKKGAGKSAEKAGRETKALGTLPPERKVSTAGAAQPRAASGKGNGKAEKPTAGARKRVGSSDRKGRTSANGGMTKVRSDRGGSASAAARANGAPAAATAAKKGGTRASTRSKPTAIAAGSTTKPGSRARSTSRARTGATSEGRPPSDTARARSSKSAST